MANKKNSLDDLKFEKEDYSDKPVRKRFKLTDDKLNRYLKIIAIISMALVSMYLLSLLAKDFIGGIFSTFGMLFSSFIIAYLLSILLEPATKLLERIKINNANVRAGIVTVVLLAIISLIIILIIIPAIRSLIISFNNIDLVETAKSAYRRIIEIVPPWMTSYLETYTSNVGESFSRIDPEKILPFLAKTSGGIARTLIMAVYTFLLLFLMLKDRDKLMKSISKVLPKKYLRHYNNITMTSENVFRHFFKGYFTVIFFLFIIALVTFLIMGTITGYGDLVRYAILFALIIAIADLIPYIGPWIGGAIVVIISILLFGDFSIVIAVIIAIVGFQAIENALLQPFIMGNSVSVHPITIFTVMLLFVSIGVGLLGIILAAPIAGIVKILYKYFKEERENAKQSEIE